MVREPRVESPRRTDEDPPTAVRLIARHTILVRIRITPPTKKAARITQAAFQNLYGEID